MAWKEAPFLALLRVVGEAVLDEQRSAIYAEPYPVPAEDEGRTDLALLVRLSGLPDGLLLLERAALGPFEIVLLSVRLQNL